MTIEFHEVANIFPMMSASEFEQLKTDIQYNGLLEAIWRHDGKIIDGRNRYQACVETGVTPHFREWDGIGSLTAFVVSLNLHRRHLTESQRGMVAAKLANMPAHRPNYKSANLRTSQLEAAEMLNVSERTVNAATKVKDEGTPELVRAVESGAASVSAAAQVATLPIEEQREIVAKGETEILKAAKEIRAKKTEARRVERIERIADLSRESIQPLTSIGRYPIILADPPWAYDFNKDDADEIENHYPTMDLEAICDLPVSESALDDCVLFLWTTSPKLEESFAVINAWGFNYRTCAIWDKEWIGPGYYFRQRHELLLVATRGSVPVPAPSSRPDSIFLEKRTAHSKKPEIAYQLIESMYPNLPKLELFSRTAREGWTVWGNQVGG
jgi:N6-adenosine-specific RNA methylase IME4